MNIGFAGTRTNISEPQRDAFVILIQQIRPTAFRHGCCCGADADAAMAVNAYVSTTCQIVGYPGHIEDLTSNLACMVCDEIHNAQDNLVRNRAIVDASPDGIIACPDGPERLRSGTWSTVRYARKIGRRIWIIMPDGEVKEEGGKVVHE